MIELMVGILRHDSSFAAFFTGMDSHVVYDTYKPAYMIVIEVIYDCIIIIIRFGTISGLKQYHSKVVIFCLMLLTHQERIRVTIPSKNLLQLESALRNIQNAQRCFGA